MEQQLDKNNRPSAAASRTMSSIAQGSSPSSKQPPCKKKRDANSSSVESESTAEDEDSVGECHSDEEDNYVSDEEGDDEYIVEFPPSPNAKVLEEAVNMVKDLIDKRNQILLPSKELPGLVDLQQCQQMGESRNDPIIYSVIQEVNGALKILKLAGATTNGSKRAASLKDKGKYPADALYIILFRLRCLDSTTHDFLLDAINKLCKNICTIVDENILKGMTIQDALNIQDEEGGVPFTLNLLAYYIFHRGAFMIHGLLKRFTIHVLESGFQEYAKRLNGLSLGDGAMECVQHEFLRGDHHLRRAAEKMQVVAKELNKLLATLMQTFGDDYVEYLRSSFIEINALSSWPPDIDCLGFTAAILDVMFGKENWMDAFLSSPPKNEEGDAYDTDGYGDDDHVAAQKNMKTFVESVKSSGCVGALDSNKCLFGNMRTTAEEYLTAKGWNLVCDLEGDDLKVYR